MMWIRRGAVLVLLAAMSAASGCSPYFVDRWNDAKDVFTVAGGVGAGAKARVGPVHVGLIANESMAGLMGGELGCGTNFGAVDMEALVCPIIVDDWPLFSYEGGRAGEDRGKWYDVDSLVPFVSTGTSSFITRGHYSASYYSQIEVVVGLGPSVRLGFNPGELLDFFLGWFGVDIYADDVTAQRRQKAAEEEEARKREEERRRREKQPPPSKPPETVK